MVAAKPAEPGIDATGAGAVRAQEAFEHWTEERVDALLFDLSRAFADRAGELAAAAVAETGLGHIADKATRIREAGLAVYDSLAGRVAQGPMAIDGDRQVTEVASPVGVIFATVPATTAV